MSQNPREFEGTWQELASHAAEFEGHRLKLIVLDADPVRDAAPTEFDPDSIEGRLMALAAKIPAEEWAKLPPDLSDRLDYYLYGTSDS